jgi:hypothetical protein
MYLRNAGVHTLRKADQQMCRRAEMQNIKTDGPVRMAGTTGLEPATSAVTGQRSNQLNYVPRVG